MKEYRYNRFKVVEDKILVWIKIVRDGDVVFANKIRKILS